MDPGKQSGHRRKGKNPVKYSMVVSSVSDSESEDEIPGDGPLINPLNIKQEKLESDDSDLSLREVSIRFPNQELAPAQQVQVPKMVSMPNQAKPQQPSPAPTVIGKSVSPTACILPAPLLQAPNMGGTLGLTTGAPNNPVGALQPVCLINNRQYMLVPIYGTGGNTPLDLTAGKMAVPLAGSSQRLEASSLNTLGQGPQSISATGTTIEISRSSEGRKKYKKTFRPSKLKVKACTGAKGNTIVSEQSDVSVKKSAQWQIKVSKTCSEDAVSSVRVLFDVRQAREIEGKKTNTTRTRQNSKDVFSSETTVAHGSPKIQGRAMSSRKSLAKPTGRASKSLDSLEGEKEILCSGTVANDSGVSSNLDPVDKGVRSRFCFETNGLTVMTNDRYLIHDDGGNPSAEVGSSESFDSGTQWQRECGNASSEGSKHFLGVKTNRCDVTNSREEDLGYPKTIPVGVQDNRLSPFNRGEVAEILSQIDTVQCIKGYNTRGKACPEMTAQFTSLSVKNAGLASFKPGSVELETDGQVSKSDPTMSRAYKLEPHYSSLKPDSEDKTDRDLIRTILDAVPILDRPGPSGANRNSGDILRTAVRNFTGHVTLHSSDERCRASEPSQNKSGRSARGSEPGSISSCGDFRYKDTELSNESGVDFVPSVIIKTEPLDADDAEKSEGGASEQFTVLNSMVVEDMPKCSSTSSCSKTHRPQSRKGLRKSSRSSSCKESVFPVPVIQIKKEPVGSYEESRTDGNFFNLLTAEKQPDFTVVESRKNASNPKSCPTDGPSCLPERVSAFVSHDVKSEVTEGESGQRTSGQRSSFSSPAASCPQLEERDGETELDAQRVVKTDPLEDSAQCSGVTIEPVSSECDTKLNRMLFDFAASISSNVRIPEVKKEPLDEDSPIVDRVLDKSTTEVVPSECAQSRTPSKRIHRKRKSSVVLPERKLRGPRTRRPMDKSIEAGYYKCYCGQGFSCLAKLVIHRRVHTGEKPWKCPTCDKCFARRDVMKRHCNIHINDRRFFCDQCPKRFLYLYELNRHRRTHTGEKRFECHLCGKRLTQMTGLKRHLDTHKGDKPYSCNICKKKFCRKSVLVKHMERRHKNISVLCPICAKGFRSKSAQIRHLASHSGTKRNQCIVCKAQFSGLYSLQRHMSIHSNTGKNRNR